MRSIRHCNVAVIGGAGFLGSHLVHHLIEDRNCQVLVIDNLVVGRKEFIHQDAIFYHHDITQSEEYLHHLFTKYCTHYVFNYAAWPYVPDSFSRPVQVFNVNTIGAMHVINSAQAAGVEGILQVSSAELYGDKYIKIHEDAMVRPHSSYGASKAAIDYYCQASWKERETPVVVLRQFNCVGERETHPYVVPEIISQIHLWSKGLPELGDLDTAPDPLIHLGNNSERDFLYAKDAIAMAVELLEKGEFGEIYNMGSEENIRIYDLAKMIGEIMGFEVHVIEDESRKRPWEIWSLRSDNAKLYSVIEHRPTTTLREALIKTVDYFANNGYRWGWESHCTYSQDSYGSLRST